MILENLKKYKILLASKSPRRNELLSELRLPFTTISKGGIDESYPDNLPAEDVPLFLSCKKADAYTGLLHQEDLLITADTVVICDGRIFGKPYDAEDAKRMLKELSGKVHTVVTGVTLSSIDKRVTFSTTTKVKFADISDEEIEYYINNCQVLDKAGAYGIQDWIGCVAVEWIEGSFYNVMGLPVHRLYKELRNF